MDIGIVVRNEKGENLSEFVNFLPLVGWDHRAQFPMLTHYDPWGSLILNHLQVRSLLAELNELDARIFRIGVEGVLRQLGSPLVSPSAEVLEDLDEVVPTFIRRLRELGETALVKVHRYVWFIGD